MATESETLDRYVQLSPSQFKHIIDHIFFKDLSTETLEEYQKPYTRDALVEYLITPLVKAANVTTFQLPPPDRQWTIFQIHDALNAVLAKYSNNPDAECSPLQRTGITTRQQKQEAVRAGIYDPIDHF